MGNSPSANSRSPSSASPASSSHESPSTSKPSSTRRDPRNLIQPQRAPAEPSLAQARGSNTGAGSTAGHRPSKSQSHPQTPARGQFHSHSQSHPPAAELQYPSPSQGFNTLSQKSSIHQMGTQPSKEESKVEEQRSKPVDVPSPNNPNIDATSIKSYSQSIDPLGHSVIQDMSSHLLRPPRLPLPIEEEVHTPGSPMLAPTDVGASLEDIESLENDVFPRRTSGLSSATLDEEEDAEELLVDQSGTTVQVAFDWKKGGDKVYVTGTIFQWNRKHRLLPVNGDPNLLRCTVPVRPGTHHIRFIVDGLMTVSTDLPTTVDFGNNLVNYIEVSVDDLPQQESAAKGEAQIIPAVNAQDLAQPTVQAEPPKPVEAEASKEAKAAPKAKAVLPEGRYTSRIPQYLLDLDKAEDSSAYQHAAAAIEKLPTPPSLPGFLGKPILNAATPMKDDNSVLTMPNHTVLNHLATSSIKNNILAVSATTRYKKKYVTTIMYKPTGDD